MCPLDISTDPFAVEHIIPLSKGGSNTVDNLALACAGCNGHKYDKVQGYDSVSDQMAMLYHPRQHFWSQHFAWNENYTHALGLTPIGRVTVSVLQMNRTPVVNLRHVLFVAGLHPPEDSTN